jgi:hypothetical protein
LRRSRAVTHLRIHARLGCQVCMEKYIFSSIKSPADLVVEYFQLFLNQFFKNPDKAKNIY